MCSRRGAIPDQITEIESNRPYGLLVKKLDPEAVLPTKANSDDSGYDVVAIDDGTWAETYIEYKTGIAIQLPIGYHVELFPRSSISKTDLLLCNSIGLVDWSYTGELKFRFKYVSAKHSPILYKKGDKIGQIVIRNTIKMNIQEVNELHVTKRGNNGFGSSGK